MVISDIDAVRLKAADRSTITREIVTANGTTKDFKLQHHPVVTGSMVVYVNNVQQVGGYTTDEAQGVVSFTVEPAINSKVEFQYYWSLFTDDEIQYFLDESASSVNLATARLLLALAADAAKLAERETLQGGGGIGMVTRDTAVTSKELRETAKALVQHELDLAELEGVSPADGFTEIAWTEANLYQLAFQDIIRQLDW